MTREPSWTRVMTEPATMFAQRLALGGRKAASSTGAEEIREGLAADLAVVVVSRSAPRSEGPKSDAGRHRARALRRSLRMEPHRADRPVSADAGQRAPA